MATFSVNAPLPPELDASTAACWSFNPEELTPRSSWRLLGEGSFGCVFLARWLGTPVAVKVNANEKANRYEGLLRDIKYLRSVPEHRRGLLARCACAFLLAAAHCPLCRCSANPHPNVVQLFGVYQTRTKLCVVMGACGQDSRGAACSSSGTHNTTHSPLSFTTHSRVLATHAA
jgi:serine/threonine protein kinase